jgi:hypothetical protein
LPYIVGCIVIDPLDGKTYRNTNDVPAGSPNPSLDPTNWVVYDIADYVGRALRVTAYSLGDTSTLPNIPAAYFLECTTAGTTAVTAPVITPPVTVGQTITDGSVVWTVRKCANTTITDSLASRFGLFKYLTTINVSGNTQTYQLTTGGYILVATHPWGTTNGLYIISYRDGYTPAVTTISAYKSTYAGVTHTLSVSVNSSGVLTVSIPTNGFADFSLYSISAMS